MPHIGNIYHYTSNLMISFLAFLDAIASLKMGPVSYSLFSPVSPVSPVAPVSSVSLVPVMHPPASGACFISIVSIGVSEMEQLLVRRNSPGAPAPPMGKQHRYRPIGSCHLGNPPIRSTDNAPPTDIIVFVFGVFVFGVFVFVYLLLANWISTPQKP